MKSYLELALMQAKARQKRNRMTVFCIALAVFLITGVFTMADAAGRQELLRAYEKHGNWHISLHDMPRSEAESVLTEEDVAASAWYDALNWDLERDYAVSGKKAAVLGADEAWLRIMDVMEEGSFPASPEEAAVSANMRSAAGFAVGDPITLQSPAGSRVYRISGFCRAGSMALYDACGVLVTFDELERLASQNGETLHPAFFVRFAGSFHVRGAVDRLMDAHGWTKEQISENTAVLALYGVSGSGYAAGLYAVAAVLMCLVMFAGILMIAGSMNTSVAQRTQYFGILRCVGASREQIKRLVLREALRWCALAVPAGAAAATPWQKRRTCFC